MIGQGSTLNLRIGELCLGLNLTYLWAEIVDSGFVFKTGLAIA